MSLVRKFVEDAQKQDSTQARVLDKAYNEDQPRDDHGRWAASGGSPEEKPKEYDRLNASGQHRAERYAANMRPTKAVLESRGWKDPNAGKHSIGDAHTYSHPDHPGHSVQVFADGSWVHTSGGDPNSASAVRVASSGGSGSGTATSGAADVLRDHLAG